MGMDEDQILMHLEEMELDLMDNQDLVVKEV